MPTEIDVRADGALRIITLNRPDSLNSVNDDLHVGLARLWQRLTDDPTARAAVITGAGRAFSAGGDFGYLKELSADADLRAKTIRDGREIVLGMARCRIPVVAAVNGPAVGLGCSLVALSDIVYIAENAYLADPHVQVGLVAADGGPLTWPLHISLLLAKEYALTGTRISAQRAVELGLANHV
ncbi:enoyl-CoA hydratase, partial [Mycobacterium avium subsp. paratuberculosis 10-4404]